MEPQDITFDYNLFNKTRKKRREPEPVEPKPKLREEWSDWNSIVLKCDKLYEYMIENVNSMINKDILNSNFYIREGFHSLDGYADELYELYEKDIQQELISWILKELSGELFFRRDLWKPFREVNSTRWAYLGYKKMFQYKNNICQLIVDNNGSCIHFELVLYVCMDDEDGSRELKYYGTILPDMMMPDKLWNIPNGGVININCI
jgi:hypothetical protein